MNPPALLIANSAQTKLHLTVATPRGFPRECAIPFRDCRRRSFGEPRENSDLQVAMKDVATLSGAGWNIIAVALNRTNPSYIWNVVSNVTHRSLSWQP